MVILDRAPSLKVYDFKEEAVLCDIPLGTLEIFYTVLFTGYTNSEFLVLLIFTIKVRIEIRI